MFDFSTLNYPAIFVAALLSFFLGALWYSPVLFAGIWQKEVNLSDSQLAQGNMALTYGSSFLCMLVMSFALAIMIEEYSWNFSINWQIGAMKGFFVGISFVLTSIAINMLYQRKSLKLFLIDGGYQLAFLILMGIILGLWR